MPEIPVLFGPGQELMGIVNMPSGECQASAVGCILLNAGVIHRVGPHRINVKLARALAHVGVSSLRMDLSGHGDSMTSGLSLGVEVQAVRDLQDGMSELERATGVSRFMVIGLCSGAMHAYSLSLVDQRVCGLLMFDGFMFPTAATHLIRRWRRLKHAPWITIPDHLRRVLQRIATSELPLAGEPSRNPSRAQFRTAMDSLVARGVSVNILYSGSFLEHHNYSRQLNDAFRGAEFLRRIRHAYLPSLDHTLTPLSAQREFVGVVRGWVIDTIDALPSEAAAKVKA